LPLVMEFRSRVRVVSSQTTLMESRTQWVLVSPVAGKARMYRGAAFEKTNESGLV
jgi:hypothetical protein